MNFDFSEQTVLITGAAQGIGREISRQFAALGASLALCDFNAKELGNTVLICEEEIAQRSPGSPQSLYQSVFDISSKANIENFVQKTAQTGNTPEILVHVAGGVCGQQGRALEEVTEEDWRAIYAVNCDAMFWLCRALAPSMKQKKFGRLISISSIAGLGVSLTGIQAYASAKAAEVGLTRQLAHELGPFGITVNSVAPGFILSNPSTLKQWEAYGQEGQNKLLENIALRRTGEPADIAHMVLFLASPYAGWLSGQTIAVDGGK